MVNIRVTPKTKNPFTIKALSISGVTWKWHVLNHAPKPVFAVTRHTRGIRKQLQGLTADGFRACVYAVAGVSAASVTASSCFGIGIPSFFSRSASSPTIFVR